MIEIYDVVPLEWAEAARKSFLDADYDKIVQERKGQFSRDFNNVHPHIPSNSETYTSSFSRSGYLEKSSVINSCFDNFIKPAIEKELSRKIRSVDLRCYKMEEGGHFRVHKDDYVADVGFIWYLSKEWRWDWGGLLLTINPDNSASVAIPEFNKLVLMDHHGGQNPHCVTHITSYAQEPRLMLVGFLK